MRTTSAASKVLGALALFTTILSTAATAAEGPTAIAAQAVNAFGLDLFRQVAKPDANALISPYSIQSAMAMAYAGADGVTREEMTRVLHYPKDEAQTHRSFAELRRELAAVVSKSEDRVAEIKRHVPDAKEDPITLAVANRLIGQAGYDFRPQFLALLKDEYAAPFEAVDFIHNAPAVTKQVNAWVEERTRKRIGEVLSPDSLDEFTRLVLVNAIYFKSGWVKPFDASDTAPEPFHINGRIKQDVPMMRRRADLRYATGSAFSVVALNFTGGEFRLLIFRPDKVEGLASLERNLNADALAGKLKWVGGDVTLHLPKFKLKPPVFSFRAALQSLGIRSAFDLPADSANFDRMATRKADVPLALSSVFHRAYLALDENGAEAAAATEMKIIAQRIEEPKKPLVFKVDRPFLFLIQHAESGACLFLGHVTDPR